jgi:hypothetical protein
MGSFTALLLATPIFGFTLQAPTIEASVIEASVIEASIDVAARTTMELRAAVIEQAKQEGDSAGPVREKKDPQAEYKEQIKQRNNIASIHRTLGIATWAAMTLTVAAGTLAYYNLYGFGADIGNSPCVTGKTAIDCDGMRTVKNSLAITTTALYATTFTLSLLMPDPDNLSEGKGKFASTLRLHKTLRWVHFAGMVAQALVGIVIANDLLGLDRANDYGTLQALATAHLGLGLVTWGAMTWAGALMVF